MKEVIALVSDRSKAIIKPFVKPQWLLREEFVPTVIILGLMSFVTYEVVIFLLLTSFNLNRNPYTFWLELVIFGLTGYCLYFYSRVRLLSDFRNSPTSDADFEDKYDSVLELQKENNTKLEAFAHGIEQSLSAVMFFARVHLARSGNPQLQRDLMEVMERIDQIQLLLSEMRFPLNPSKAGESHTFSFSPRFESRELRGIGIPTGSQYADGGVAPTVFSLRKSARKTQIIPITVQYSCSDTQLKFHSYTVNTCDSGACIVFSDQGLTEDTVIQLEIPSEFQSRAQIRWIQPTSTNAFRLAGVEFLDNMTLKTA